MEKNALIPKNMDDLVFENRNQEYGAYAVRKSYSSNMNTGFLSCVLFAVGLLTMNQVLALFGDPPIPLPKPFTNSTVLDSSPPVIIPIEKPKGPPPPKRNAAAPVVPTVTTQIVPDQPVPDQSATPDMGEDDGVGTDPNAEIFGDPNSSGANLTTTTSPTEVLDFVQIMPKFKGGDLEMMRFIQRKTRYPARSRRMDIEGTVFVQFVVRSDSTITGVKVLRGISEDCDKEAVRVISSMPKWEPGIQSKMAVNVRMVVPIRFVLDR
jgi:protein TonB